MLSGRLGQGMQNPYVGYSSMRGGLVTFDPPPPAPKECWHESYAPVDIIADGAHQQFYVDSIEDYSLGCDALVQYNGVFMDPNDYFFIADNVDYNFEVVAYVKAGDWISFESITDSDQIFWLQEFYWTVQQAGKNQVYNDPTLQNWAGGRTLANTNLSLNGVLLTMGTDFTFDAKIGITFYCLLDVGDVVGILPTCAGPSARAIKTPLVPQLVFIAVSTGQNQIFTDVLLTGYTSSSDMIVTKDGVVLEPDVDYSLAGSTLTVFPKLTVLTEIIVLANSRSCATFLGANIQTQSFDLFLTQNNDLLITENGL